MSYETIRIEQDGQGIARLILARPEKHNALNAAMIGELTDAARSLGARSQIRAIVLQSDGGTFCAGADLDWMRQQFGASRETRISQARALAHMLRALNEMPKPLIAAVQGAAYGGGVGMISVCDTAITSDTAKFGLTETRLGLIPATIGPYVLARIGEANARRGILSARVFDASEAKRIGLIGDVVRPAELDTKITSEAAAFLSVAPGAVASAKALIRRLSIPITDDLIEDTISRLADAWETAEVAEGLSAFFEKRKPAWLVT